MARWGSLPGPVARLAGKALGFRQVLFTPAAVDAALSHDEVIVPYGPRSDMLGLSGFPLALDGDDHETARAHLAATIDATGAAHDQGVVRAGEVARRVVDGAQGRLDVVEDLIEPALQAWVETWFGLPGLGPDLHQAGQAIMHAIFLNPKTPRGTTDPRALVWSRAVTARVETAIAGAQPLHPLPGDLTLIQRLEKDPPPESSGLSAVLGLTVGPLALGSMAMANAIDEILDDRTIDHVADAAAGGRLFRTALGRRPPLPGLPRACPRDLTVQGADHVSHHLPEGPFLAATQVAARLDHAGDPAEWAFGAGPHACMGAGLITEVAGGVLAALALRRPRRIPGPRGRMAQAAAPSGVREWTFPGSLLVSVDG